VGAKFRAPMPEEDFVEASRGSEERALKELVEALMTLHGNQGLEAGLNDRPG
jgi:hypothetical protein